MRHNGTITDLTINNTNTLQGNVACTWMYETLNENILARGSNSFGWLTITKKDNNWEPPEVYVYVASFWVLSNNLS